MKKYARKIERAVAYILVAFLISSCTLVQIRAQGPIEDTIDIPQDAVEEIVIAEPSEPEDAVIDILVAPVVDTAKVVEKRYYDIPLDKDLQDHIFEICKERDIDPAIVIGIIERESDFRPKLMGDGGKSYGLMQVMKKWHVGRMKKLGVTNLKDPYQNVLVGIDYLDELIDRDRGVEWALMAYNGGPSYANRKSASGVVTDYARGVLGYAGGLDMK